MHNPNTTVSSLEFRNLVSNEKPLKVVGIINAYTALLAERSGIKAIYLSGAGVANSCFGLPDLGLSTLTDVATEVARITQVTKLPLLVDGDTGWGGNLNVEYTVQTLIKHGAAAVHFEDQEWPKRCGHRDGKNLVSAKEMSSKISAAVEIRNKLCPEFIIMARTDATSVEGLDSAIKRAKKYVASGADMIFAEAITSLDDYKIFVKEMQTVPVLANITEFGKTPLFSATELHSVGIKLMLFPLTAFRAMNNTAIKVFNTIAKEGTQKQIISSMQTRDELYEILNYHEFEQKLK